MKPKLLLFLFLLIPSLCWAGKCYVYIDKTGNPDPGEEAGQTEKGDVVAIYPCTAQYKPTPSERTSYLIKVVDIPANVRLQLLESEVNITYSDEIVEMPKANYQEWIDDANEMSKNAIFYKDKGNKREVTVRVANERTLRARRLKVNLTQLSPIQEEEVNVTEISNKIITKPSITISR